MECRFCKQLCNFSAQSGLRFTVCISCKTSFQFNNDELICIYFYPNAESKETQYCLNIDFQNNVSNIWKINDTTIGTLVLCLNYIIDADPLTSTSIINRLLNLKVFS